MQSSNFKLVSMISCWRPSRYCLLILNVQVTISLDFCFNVFDCHLLSSNSEFLVLLLSPWQRSRTSRRCLFGFLSLSFPEHVRGGNTEMRAPWSTRRPLPCHKAMRGWIELSSGSSEMFPCASSPWWAMRGWLWVWEWSLMWTRGPGQCT